MQSLRLMHNLYAITRANSSCTGFHHDYAVIDRFDASAGFDLHPLAYDALHQGYILLRGALTVESGTGLYGVCRRSFSYLATSNYFVAGEL